MKANKPPYINPSSGASARKSRHWIPRDISGLLLAFVIITIGSAGLYYLGSSHGWGIQATFQSGRSDGSESVLKISFLDCLHFSVVTITTLGYGDYRPESFGRLVAAIEVISGIVLMGVLISRLVSRQQDRLTKRLLGGQLNSEIQDFREMLSEVLEGFSQIPQPAAALPTDLLYKADGLAKSLARYWRYESKQPDFAAVTPVKATGRMLGEIVIVLESITTMVEGKQPVEIGESNRTHIRNITESSLAIADILESHIEDVGIKHSAASIYASVERLRTQLQLKIIRLKT